MDKSSALRDYLLVLRRRWWLVAGAVIVTLVVAMVASYAATPMYKATAQLRYQKQADISAAISGATVVTSTLESKLEIATYANLMSSEEMRVLAKKQAPSLDLTRDNVQVSAEYVEDTNVMTVSAVSADPETAQRAANAYSTAFVRSRTEAIVRQYREAEGIVEDKLERFTVQQKADKDPAYVSLLGRLEDLRVLEAAATGNFVIAAEAQLPTEPFTPNHMRDAVIAIMIGFIVGIGLVALAEQLDVRAHSVEDITDLLGLPVIGRLPRLGKDPMARGGLQVVSQPQGPVSEAFRMVRSNLEFVDVDGDVKSILFTSCSQSEGKTTTVCNLAVTLARSGKHVIVVDADLRRPHVHTMFKLQNRVGISTVVTGQSSLENAPAAHSRIAVQGLQPRFAPSCSHPGRCRPTRARSSPRAGWRPSSASSRPRPTSCSSTRRRSSLSATRRPWRATSRASSWWPGSTRSRRR